jgi:NAD(P)H-nitrite reductase large subunit
MATADPAVFSCGDAAELPCGSFGLLSAAKSMGHTAGINAAGGNEDFIPEIYPVRLMALGIKLFSAGKLNDAVSESVGSQGNYQRLTRDQQGNLTGVILLGDLKAAVKLQKELVC